MATTNLTPGRHVLPIGAVFAGRYRVLAWLGSGGMGDVYRVHDATADDVVALKILGAQDDDSVERFKRELRLARRVTHKNVARTFDLGDHEGLLFLTMELVEGTSLADVLRGGRLEPGRAAGFASGVAEGLRAAHEAGVVHRDLKPGNVLVTKAQRAVIIDFGVARGLTSDLRTHPTESFVGTLEYMAPEQLANEPVGPFTDVYALGVMLFEMLSGRRPFAGETAMARGLARLLRPPPDLRTFVPGLGQYGDELALLVDRCLARTPAGRPTMTGLLAVLARVAPDATAAPAAPAGPVAGAPADPTLAFPQATTSVDDLLDDDDDRAAPPPSGRTLAVMPFTSRDPAHRDLAAGVADELVDVLSMTRGLRVLTAGAVQSVLGDGPGERDPRTLGAALGVENVVEGSLTVGARQVRIAARLVEVSSGVQVWAGHFDGRLEEVLKLQARMAHRIAEALRVQLEVVAWEGSVPAAALELYLRARRMLRTLGMGPPTEAVELIDRCLALAPGFRLGSACRAIACARAWFMPDVEGSARWALETPRAVAAALAVAGDLPDTHLAAAMCALQQGRLADAVEGYRRALAIAPTHAFAQSFLARAEVEAGRPVEGVRRARLAVDLDRSLISTLSVVARDHALRGRMAEYDDIVERMRRHSPEPMAELANLQVRVADWRGDPAPAAAILATLSQAPLPAHVFLGLFARLVAGEPVYAELSQVIEAIADLPASPRFQAFGLQMAAEIYARREPGRALDHLERSLALPFFDLEWLDRCPVLADLRHAPRFIAVRDATLRRVDEMWKE